MNKYSENIDHALVLAAEVNEQRGGKYHTKHKRKARAKTFYVERFLPQMTAADEVINDLAELRAAYLVMRRDFRKDPSDLDPRLRPIVEAMTALFDQAQAQASLGDRERSE